MIGALIIGIGFWVLGHILLKQLPLVFWAFLIIAIVDSTIAIIRNAQNSSGTCLGHGIGSGPHAVAGSRCTGGAGPWPELS